MKFCLVLLLFLSGTSAGVLELSGSGSQIEFGHTRATVTASCIDALESSISYVRPTQLLEADLAAKLNMTVEFKGVSPTCLDTSSTSPCVSHDDGIPPSFFCKFTGSLSSMVTSGPHRAYLAKIEHAGIVLGLATRLECPQPSYAQRISLAGSGQGGTDSLTLTVVYDPPGLSAVDIVLSGPGSNTIEFAQPPVPPPPSPSTPPPYSPSPSSPSTRFTLGAPELASALLTNTVSGSSRELRHQSDDSPVFYVRLPSSSTMSTSDAFTLTIKLGWSYSGDNDPRFGITDLSDGEGVRLWDQDLVAHIKFDHSSTTGKWKTPTFTQSTRGTFTHSSGEVATLVYTYPEGTGTGTLVCTMTSGQSVTYTAPHNGMKRLDPNNLHFVFVNHNNAEVYNINSFELRDDESGVSVGTYTGAELGN